MNFYSTVCPIVVDLDENAVFAQGKASAVEPEVAEALFVMANKWPRPVTIDEMITGLYGLKEPYDAARMTRQVVARASQVLAGSFPGIGIATTYASTKEHGYKGGRTQTEFRLVVSSAREAA